MATDDAAKTKAKVLLVDDDASWRKLYTLELSRKQYQVVEAGDGEEGLLKAKSDKPDIILLDIMMPKIDGIAVLKKIKEDTDLKKIPILILTNFGQENLTREAFNLGITDYILKYQITPAELAEKISQTLSAHSA